MKVRHTLQLRHKILLVFAMTWAVAIIVIGIVSLYGRIKENRHAEIEKNAVTLNACKTAAQNNIDAVNLTAMEFTLNDNVSQLMSSDFTGRQQQEQNRIINRIDMSIYTNAYRTIFKTGLSIGFFCQDGRVYANPQYHIRRVDNDPEDASIIGRPVTDGNTSYEIKRNDIFKRKDNDVNAVYLRSFRVRGSSGETGTIALIIPRGFLTEGFGRVTDRDWAVLDRTGIIIESGDPENIGKPSASVYGFSRQPDDYSDESGSISNKAGIVSYAHDEKNNLTYMIFTPQSVILKPLEAYVGIMILICIGIILVLFGLSWYLSRRFTQPLDRLQGIMKEAEQGNLDVRVNPTSDDEIGRIGASFDRMIHKLSISVKDIQRVEQENRRAEMKIMELQLKPHFLYNTLSSIIWLANADRISEVIDITKSLALFYRVTLADGHEEILAGDELGNVKNYANIQHYRYQDKFKVYYDVSKEIDGCLVPKLILQPLVENSINYGMKPRGDTHGLIRIRGYLESNELIFEVIDNGEEASEESIEALNHRLEEKTSGIGTGNVYGRVNHYGEQYRLVYIRKDGNTIARINLPVKRVTDDESFSS